MKMLSNWCAAEINEDVLRKIAVGENMVSGKEKLGKTSPVHNGDDKHFNPVKDPYELAETAIEQTAPLGKGETKSSEVDVVTAVAASAVAHLPSKYTYRKKSYKRKHSDKKMLEEEGEEGVSVVSGDKHAAAAMERPLLRLTADALLPDGGIRAIITQIKKRGKLRNSSTVSLGGEDGHETELLPIEAAPLKVGGKVSSTPRKRKGRPRRLNIGTINDLPAGIPSPSSKAIIQWNGSSSFMRCSPIWKAIESMQAFHRFPQTPHFLPLLDLKEDSREGFAIGYMVTFANVVDKAFKLNITEDLTTCLDTLQDLEPHGFDVTAVRDHLNKMLSIKEKLLEKKKQLENRILELTYEHSEIDKEIVEFNEKMKCLQEKLALAKSKKQEKISKIVLLKVKSGSISQLIDGSAHRMEDPDEYCLKVASFLRADS